jgi:hypothetical protein
VEPLKKALVIDGVAGSSDRDSTGEVLALSGADISEMVKRGLYNDNHSTGIANTLGKITEAKKLLKESDAVTPRQKMYWEKYKRPILYVKGYLFSDGDHPGVKAAIATMQTFEKMGDGKMGMSVEGKVVDRGPNGLLKESIIRNVALTLTPANPNTEAHIIGEAPMAKSVTPRTIAMDSFSIYEADLDGLEKVASKLDSIADMFKALSAGYGATGAPSGRSGGAALTPESRPIGSKLSYVTFKKEVLKALIKSMLRHNTGYTPSEILDMSFQIARKFKD